MTMRYEHIELDLSTAGCAALRDALEAKRTPPWGFAENAVANAELHQLYNELLARLQRTDADPRCWKNRPHTHEWTDVARCLVCDLTYDKYDPAAETAPVDNSDLLG